MNQNGSFTFGSSVRFNSAYAVTVRTNPAGQTCTVSNGSGTVGAGNVTNIGVTCTDNLYTVGGDVSGLTGTVVLSNSGGNPVSGSANGASYVLFVGRILHAGTPFAVQSAARKPNLPSSRAALAQDRRWQRHPNV